MGNWPSVLGTASFLVILGGSSMEPVLVLGTRQPQRQVVETELGKLTPPWLPELRCDRAVDD